MNAQQLFALSDDDLRVKVAEALGWTILSQRSPCNSGGEIIFSPVGYPPPGKDAIKDCRSPTYVAGFGSDGQVYALPYFCTDLNACRKMEHFVEYECEQWSGDESDADATAAYMGHLRRLTKHDDWLFVGATARQRCIAFLLTTQKETK